MLLRLLFAAQKKLGFCIHPSNIHHKYLYINEGNVIQEHLRHPEKIPETLTDLHDIRSFYLFHFPPAPTI